MLFHILHVFASNQAFSSQLPFSFILQAADERRSRAGEVKLQDTEERLQDREILGRGDWGQECAEHSNTPSTLQAVLRSLEARAAPGRALLLHSAPAKAQGGSTGMLQGLLFLPSLAALIPPCVLHLFRGLTQNPAPSSPLWGTSPCQTEMLCFLLLPAEKLRSMSGGQQQFSNYLGIYLFVYVF